MNRKEVLKELLEAVFGRTAIKIEDYSGEVVYEKGWYDVNTSSEGYRDNKYLHLFRATLTDPKVYVMKGGANSQKQYLRNTWLTNAIKYFRTHGAKCLMGVEINLYNEDTLTKLGNTLYEAFRIMLYDLFGKGCNASDDVTAEYGLKMAEAIHYLDENVHLEILPDILIDGRNLILKDANNGGSYNYAFLQETPIVRVTPIRINVIPPQALEDIVESPEESIHGLRRIEVYDNIIRLLPTRYSFSRVKSQLEIDAPNAVYAPITSPIILWIPAYCYYLTNLKEENINSEDANVLRERMRVSAKKLFFDQYGKQIADYYYSVTKYIESAFLIIIKIIDDGIAEGIRDEEHYMSILKTFSLTDEQLSNIEREYTRLDNSSDFIRQLLSQIEDATIRFAKQISQQELMKAYQRFLSPHSLHQHYEAISKIVVIDKLKDAAQKYSSFLLSKQLNETDTSSKKIIYDGGNYPIVNLFTESIRVNCYDTLLKAIELYIDRLGELVGIEQKYEAKID